MSLLGDAIDAAVASAIAEHPKLFAADSKAKAQKILVREIMKGLTAKRAQDDSEPVETSAAEPKPGEPVAAEDERAVAYSNLRIVAGAVAPMTVDGDRIYLPIEGDTVAVRTFAALPARSEWGFVTERRQLIAWDEFFAAHLPRVARRDIKTERDGTFGADLPWPWPPSKAGKIYPHGCEDEIAA